MPTYKAAKAAIYGVPEKVLPIDNLPSDTRKVKFRLRNDDFGRALVFRPGGVERWILGPKDNRFPCTEWSLSILEAYNQAK